MFDIEDFAILPFESNRLCRSPAVHQQRTHTDPSRLQYYHAERTGTSLFGGVCSCCHLLSSVRYGG